MHGLSYTIVHEMCLDKDGNWTNVSRHINMSPINVQINNTKAVAANRTTVTMCTALHTSVALKSLVFCESPFPSSFSTIQGLLHSTASERSVCKDALTAHKCASVRESTSKVPCTTSVNKSMQAKHGNVYSIYSTSKRPDTLRIIWRANHTQSKCPVQIKWICQHIQRLLHIHCTYII